MASRLVTELQSVAYSGGSLRYELYLYTNEGRTTLAYQAGDDAADNAIHGDHFHRPHPLGVVRRHDHLRDHHQLLDGRHRDPRV